MTISTYPATLLKISTGRQMNLNQYSKLRTAHIKNQHISACKYQDVYFVSDTYPYNITKESSMYDPKNDRIVCGGISDIERHGIYLDAQLHNYFTNEKDAHNKQRNRLFDYRAQKDLTMMR